MKIKPVYTKLIFISALLICLTPIVNSPIALILGFLLAYFFGNPFITWTNVAVKWLLKIAVVGLGFGMHLQETINAGKDGLLLTVFSIISVLVLGWLIGKALKLHKNTSHLISSGTAICGGSAIAAVSSVINAKEKEISISLGVIFLLNSIALIIFPPIGHFFDLSQYQFGLWSAIAIHDTSSVVGAALTYGNEALKTATTVKLARALWIIPISFLTMYLFKSKNGKVNIPWFIFLFMGAILVNSFFYLPDYLTQTITGISKKLLVVTLFFIGAGLSAEAVKESGIKPIVLGVILWLFISISSLAIISNNLF